MSSSEKAGKSVPFNARGERGGKLELAPLELALGFIGEGISSRGMLGCMLVPNLRRALARNCFIEEFTIEGSYPKRSKSSRYACLRRACDAFERLPTGSLHVATSFAYGRSPAWYLRASQGTVA